MFKIFSIGAMAVCLLSCNVTRVVKPLDKGEHQMGASLGGPVIVFAGAPIPMPLTSISYATGIDTGITFVGGLHTTSLLFGNAEVDLNLGVGVYKSGDERFGVTLTPGVHLLYGFRGGDLRIYPQLEAIAWKAYGKRENLLYGGIGTWVELTRVKAYGEIQNHELMPYISLGHQFSRERWNFSIEARYLGPTYSNEDIVVNYFTPLNTGAAGLYFGITRKLTR